MIHNHCYGLDIKGGLMPPQTDYSYLFSVIMLLLNSRELSNAHSNTIPVLVGDVP